MEPFKEKYNAQGIQQLAYALERQDIDAAPFVHAALDGLDDLELKERCAQISEALDLVLPPEFDQACTVMIACLYDGEKPESYETVSGEQGVTGWMSLVLTAYVARHGLGHFDISMATLKALTPHFSAEFDIRFFLLQSWDQCLPVLQAWASDPNHHVRRLVSEGTRPRLPWAMQLPFLIKDPAPMLPLLIQLRDDPEEYVRRSVANHLNDIAKDHPDLVANLMMDWKQDADKNRMRLIKHALRSLIKQGHAQALAVIDIFPPDIRLDGPTISTDTVIFGESLDFSIILHNPTTKPQNLVLDYVLHFKKANGKLAPKVFKWSNFILAPGESRELFRRHPIKPISTRKYYGGEQRLSLQINGQGFGDAAFELEMADDK